MHRHVDESCTTIPDNSSSNSSQIPNSPINVGSNLILQLATPDQERQENPPQKLPISSCREIRVEADQNFAIHFKGFRRLPLLLLQPRGTARRRTAACYTAPQTIKKSFTEKFVHIFQPKPPKLAAQRSETASRTRFPSCHIYQLRLGLKFGILEAWSWSAECPRLATVGLASSSSSSAAATASCENGALSLLLPPPPAARHGS